MKKLIFLLFVTISVTSFAQDTTWVQTFTFDSITTRRADFVFPPELNNKRFEKVLMYYKLKCDPATTWDSYNCGEWDYLTYTRVYDHTGQYDSVQVDSVAFMNNFNSPATYSYVPWGYNYLHSKEIYENDRAAVPSTDVPVFSLTDASTNYPFDQTKKGSIYQMHITAAELTAAGLMANDEINSLNLQVMSVTGSGKLMHPTIGMKHGVLGDMHSGGFTEVYNLSRNGSAAPVLTSGLNKFYFYQPFVWNGIDDIVVEFRHDSGVQPTNTATYSSFTAAPGNASFYSGRNGVLEFSGSNYASLELSDTNLGDNITIMFWAKGNGNTGMNTSILEAYDTINQRVINIHMPWSNDNLYWDAGEGNGYDRIFTSMSGAGIDAEWHHWAFVKNTTTGVMEIYRDGALFHSGTGLTLPIGQMHRFVIGANMNQGNNWKGKIDEFQVFSEALDGTTILNWFKRKTDAGHPFWSNLLVYYDFDEEEYAIDHSPNGYLMMPSEQGMFDFSEYPRAGVNYLVGVPEIEFDIAPNANASTQVVVVREDLVEPEVVFEYAVDNQHFAITNAFVAAPEGTEDVYDITGALVSSTPFSGTSTLTNSTITYFLDPYEIIKNVEIGRFITPYGIGFDLGPDGFTWKGEVTDYQMYLKDTVDLAAHNTQELIDLKFAFIEGIPPRDVHHREPIWSDYKSYSYGNLDNDISLPATSVMLSDTSSMFKIKTRMTGHGHNGNTNCCEWDPKIHEILVDGVSRFNWDIWEETQCGDSPNPEQGGTWPYAREGWCPGDLVKEYDHELTPYVTPGTSVTLDYDIEDVPVGDPGQANGNYIVAMDLISYSAPNFQHDATILDILNPNDWEYYRKWNPGCQNPRVILQNTGEQPLTSCKITCWLTGSNPVVYQWSGNLAFLEKEIVEIPIPDPSFWLDYWGLQTFHVSVGDVEGAQLDEYPQNDYNSAKFELPEFINGEFLVWLNTNNKANENSWRLEDHMGNIIFQRTTLSNTTDYKDTFDLAPGCYSIIVEDSDSDGMGFWYSNLPPGAPYYGEGETYANMRIKLTGGGYVEFFPTDFGNFHRYNFSVGFALGQEEQALTHELGVYPNPNGGEFYVELSGTIKGEANMYIYDMMGRQLLSQKMNTMANAATTQVSMPEAPSGHYIIKVITNDEVYTTDYIKR